MRVLWHCCITWYGMGWDGNEGLGEPGGYSLFQMFSIFFLSDGAGGFAFFLMMAGMGITDYAMMARSVSGGLKGVLADEVALYQYRQTCSTCMFFAVCHSFTHTHHSSSK